jgi:hypothetical protein
MPAICTARFSALRAEPSPSGAPLRDVNIHGAAGRVSRQYVRKIASSRGLSIT